MMKKAKLKILLGILSVLSSCVEEYTLPTTTSYVEPEIVIQGRILTGGKSVVYLTNTTPFNSNEEAPDILNAQVHIIGQNGGVYVKRCKIRTDFFEHFGGVLF